MSALKEKFAKAKNDYEVACRELATAQHIFENEHEKSYAVIKENIVILKSKIEENEKAIRPIVSSFAKELRASNGSVTSAVKASLNERRNREDVISECHAILKEVEIQKEAMRLAGSSAANNYIGLYDKALKAHAMLKVYTALTHCEQQFYDVLDCQSPIVVGTTGVRGGLESTPMQELLLHELKTMFISHESKNIPYPPEIGKLNLGSFFRSEIMTPAEQGLAKRQQ